MRPARPEDASGWLSLRRALWPASGSEHESDIAAYFGPLGEAQLCLVAADRQGALVGFVEVGLRVHAEGCSTSPVGYIEGIFVLPDHRMHGVGRALVAQAERWAAARGCTEMASDRELVNEPSGLFHSALGYEEVERIVCFRKSLTPTGETP